MQKVLVITVNFRGADSTELFLESASKLERFEAAYFLVVENDSRDGSAEKLRAVAARFGNVELIESTSNRGYFGGANWALQQYLRTARRPDWVVVCNNDIVFDDPKFLSKLLDRNSESMPVIAPAIIARRNNLDSNPFLRKRLTSMQLWQYRFWYSNYYLTWLMQLLSPYVRIVRRHFYPWHAKAESKECEAIYAPHGSFLIFSSAYFNAGGFIDDGFFLYAEEFSVAEICLRLGLRVVYDPDLKVWHYGHRTTGRLLNRSTFEHTRFGLHYALKKYLHEANPGKRTELT